LLTQIATFAMSAELLDMPWANSLCRVDASMVPVFAAFPMVSIIVA